MRTGIPEPVARHKTITLYTDKSAFRRALDLGPEDRIYAVLLDPQARVVTTVEGPADPQAVEQVISAASALPQGPAPAPDGVDRSPISP
jgi:hypothetical protein